MIADGHDICCECNSPFAHLLDSIFPEGHKDRYKKISYIIERDYNQSCHSGGEEEKDSGIPTDIKRTSGDGQKEEREEPFGDADDLLMAAVAAAEEGDTR